MGFQFADFFSSNSNSLVQNDIQNLTTKPSFCECLISGPKSSGKTSLLFHLAATLECDETGEGRHVLYLCGREGMEVSPPLLTEGLTPHAQAFHRLHLKYIETDEELRLFFASFHLLPLLPALVIVDDFSSFFLDSRYKGDRQALDKAVVKTLALMKHAIEFARQGRSPDSCKLAVSDLSVEGRPKSLFLFQRWLPAVFLISECSSEGGFAFSRYQAIGHPNSSSTAAVYYHLGQNHLVVDKVNSQFILDDARHKYG
mmetsp:Transcript_21783/g.30301  ORF Transcript_21783/g.30301 Transcript_21783/m.30301 type:complete len:257 (+) Transcript_21783:178-948(+)